MKSNLKFCVIGSGSWATAIVKILSENLKEINWYTQFADCSQFIGLQSCAKETDPEPFYGVKWPFSKGRGRQ